MLFDKILERKNTNSTKYKGIIDDTIPLCVADMDFMPPANIICKVKYLTTNYVYGYTYANDDFYLSIINWMYKRHQWFIKREHILLSQSVLSSLTSAIRCFSNVNDDIIVLSPEYHAFFYLIERNQRNVIECPLKKSEMRYEINFDILESYITNKTKILLLSSPHNPTGNVWKKHELKLLGELCLKYNILIFSDEIHSDIIYGSNKHIPIASISKAIADITITFNSPSKSFNLIGMTLSFVILLNAKLLEKLQIQLRNDLYDKVNIINHQVLTTAYKEDIWLDQLIKYLHNNILLIEHALKDNHSPITFLKPEGTFLLWLNFNNLGLSHDEVNTKLNTIAKVRLASGIDFSLVDGELYFRMNIALSKQKLQKVINQIIKTFQ